MKYIIYSGLIVMTILTQIPTESSAQEKGILIEVDPRENRSQESIRKEMEDLILQNSPKKDLKYYKKGLKYIEKEKFDKAHALVLKMTYPQLEVKLRKQLLRSLAKSSQYKKILPILKHDFYKDKKKYQEVSARRAAIYLARSGHIEEATACLPMIPEGRIKEKVLQKIAGYSKEKSESPQQKYNELIENSAWLSEQERNTQLSKISNSFASRTDWSQAMRMAEKITDKKIRIKTYINVYERKALTTSEKELLKNSQALNQEKRSALNTVMVIKYAEERKEKKAKQLMSGIKDQTLINHIVSKVISSPSDLSKSERQKWIQHIKGNDPLKQFLQNQLKDKN